MTRLPCIAFVTLAAMLFPVIPGVTAARAAAAYKVTRIVSLGAPDRWDYVTFDPPSGRVYIAHGDRITVVDGQTGNLIGNVTGITGVTHGIAISHDTGQGFTDDGNAGEAIAFDLKTLKVTKHIKAEPDADGIIEDPTSGHFFIIDGDKAALTVIDPKSDTSIATIKTGGALEFGVAGGNGKLYVNGFEKHEILRVDTATNVVDAHWPMPTCEKPHGLAIDRANHRLFSTCANQVMVVMDAESGKVLASLPIGKGSDAAAFDARTHLAYSSNFEGTLSVVAEKSPHEFVTMDAIQTVQSARTMALDPKSGRIYLAAATITVNKSAAPHDYHHRYLVTPGSLKLLFMDPANSP